MNMWLSGPSGPHSAQEFSLPPFSSASVLGSPKHHRPQEVHADPPVRPSPQENPNCFNLSYEALAAPQPHFLTLWLEDQMTGGT